MVGTDMGKVDPQNEEYYSVVVWKDTEGKLHIVGTLAYFEGKYYFKYEQASLRKARDKNFTDIASFNDDERLYVSENSLFNFFKMRVSERVKETPAAMNELIQKRGRSTVDDISILEVPKSYRPAIKAEMKRIEKNQIKLKEEKEDSGKQPEGF